MWQYIIVGILLLVAVYYVGRVVVRALRSDGHDCPDCDVPGKKK